jgi:hypothetical protein
MDWTLEKIRAEVRKLTGRRSENSLSNSDLDYRINNFYTLILPYEIDVHEFNGFESFTTSAGTETYSKPADVLRVEPHVTITNSDGEEYEVELYLDPVSFKTDYPDAGNDETTERERPTAMLLHADTFYLRPVPDDTYTVKYPAKLQSPTEFSSISDMPEDNAWGLLISLGAAIHIHKAAGEHDEADQYADTYETLKAAISRKQLLRYPATHRAAPRF